MTETKRPDATQHVAPPPANLLHGAPRATELRAEVRSDASIQFDPAAAPAYLHLPADGFGALFTWSVSVSWTEAEQIQAWLVAPHPISADQTQEQGLADLFDKLQVTSGGAPHAFLTYVGAYLVSGESSASYRMVVGMRVPVKREDYQEALISRLAKLKENPATVVWYKSLVNFFQMMLNPPTAREEFLLLAANVGSLKANRASHPTISMLLDP
jgi:hypothetical protein